MTALQEMKTAVAAELNGCSGVVATVVEPVGAAEGVVVVQIDCSAEHKVRTGHTSVKPKCI